MAKAIWKDIVLAESDDIALVEGNVYFPRKDVDWGYIQLSDDLPETYCHWKGMAEYYDIFIGDEPQVLDVDHVVICAGQEPLRELVDGLESAGKTYHLIGGADVAAELDAKRAIRQASELAAVV